MNIKPSATVPAISSKRTTLRRAITTAVVGCTLALGIASAQAGGASDGKFSVAGVAGFSKKGEEDPKKDKTIAVEGTGTFTAKFAGDDLVLTSDDGNIDMGPRQKHTKSEFLKDNHKVELRIAKSALTFPKDGETKSGDADGKLTMARGKGMPVKIHYTVKDAGDKYEIQKAKFTFDHSAANGGERVCLPLVKTPCVYSKISVEASGSVKK
jgi:hypothetical protein